MDKTTIAEHGFLLAEQVAETSRTMTWRAVQKTLDRMVVLRILKEEIAGDPREVTHFLTVARRIAKIKCGALAAIYNVVSVPPLHYVVMEHVEGVTLEEHLARHGPMSQNEALRIGAALCDGLDQMWSNARVIHGNLKSASIRLDLRGQPKLTDFRLVATGGSEIAAVPTDHRMTENTPCFLSPEQAEDLSALTPGSDIYAFGVLLYHLVTAHLPFEERRISGALEAPIHDQFPAPHLLCQNVTEAFSWFLRNLLMKQPHDRYADWQEVACEIQRLREHQPPHAQQQRSPAPSTLSFDVAPPSVSQGAVSETVWPDKRIRMRAIRRERAIAAYQTKHLVDAHTAEIERETRRREAFCWTGLILWLLLLFWFRAVRQAGLDDRQAFTSLTQHLASRATPTLAEAPRATQKTEAPPPPLADTSSQPARTTIPDDLAHALARALLAEQPDVAHRLVTEARGPFDNKQALRDLLTRVPRTDDLVTEALTAHIGAPLTFLHNGNPRSATLRGVTNEMLRLEVNGREGLIPLARFSAAEKSAWLSPPEDPARLTAYGLLLLQAGRTREAQAAIAAHAPLVPVFRAAATMRDPARHPETPSAQ